MNFVNYENFIVVFFQPTIKLSQMMQDQLDRHLAALVRNIHNISNRADRLLGAVGNKMMDSIRAAFANMYRVLHVKIVQKHVSDGKTKFVFSKL